MVTRLGVFRLMCVMNDLSYVYERCRSVTVQPSQLTQVKEENYILDALKRPQQSIATLAQNFHEIKSVVDGLANWIAYLDKGYVLQSALFGGKPMYLERTDAECLAKDIEQWRATILAIYQQQRTVLIKEDNLDSVFPNSMLSKLDDLAKEDLNDAISCVLHLFPTPASMISLRVAENIVRKYYERITGNSASGKMWSQLLQEMETQPLIKKSTLGYIRFLKDKRNEAEHPDKRFTQEESERILLNIKDLLEELK